MALPTVKQRVVRGSSAVLLMGDWEYLKPLERRYLPPLPRREDGEGWSDRTQDAWETWAQDPVTQKWRPTEIQAALDLIYMYEVWVQHPEWTSVSVQVRRRQEDLGLTLKGLQERRWKLWDPEEDAKAPAPRVEPQRLTAVQ